MEDAEAVAQPLESVPGARERVGHALVGDDDEPALIEQAAAGAQDLDRIGHVVQRLVHVDEVVSPLEPRVGCVAVVEPDAVLDAAAREVLPRGGDRRLVEVDAVDLRVRIGPRDRNRRVALAAGDVGNPCGRIGLEPLVCLGDLREPLAAEQVLEHRARELGLALVQVGAVVRIGDAVAAAERVEHRVDRTHARHDELADGRDVVEARLVEEGLVVTGRQRETALLVDLEDARRRLLLEPFADVALV